MTDSINLNPVAFRRRGFQCKRVARLIMIYASVLISEFGCRISPRFLWHSFVVESASKGYELID